MQRIVIRSNNDGFLNKNKISSRGARVFGYPVSKDIASYLEDANPDFHQQRLMTMFFAGNMDSNIEEETLIPDDEDI